MPGANVKLAGASGLDCRRIYYNGHGESRASPGNVRDEHALWSELWTLHIGTDSPSPERHLGIQHLIPEETAISRLKPARKLKGPDERAKEAPG